MAGVGVLTHEEGFTGAFAKEMSKLFSENVEWKVYGKNGYTAKLVMYKIIPEVKETKADVVVVGLGANDAFTLNRPSKWNKEIRLLIKSIKSKFPHSFIVFCNMPPIKEFPAFTSLIKLTVGNLVEILGQELEKIVLDYSDVIYAADIISFENWVDRIEPGMEKSDFFSDGVHPSKLTYQIWGKAIANEIFQNEIIRDAIQKLKRGI